MKRSHLDRIASLRRVGAASLVSLSCASGAWGAQPPEATDAGPEAELSVPGASRFGDGSGWDKNFRIENDDASQLLKIKGRLQIRYSFNLREDDPLLVGTGNEVTQGFSLRRTRLEAQGETADGRFGYTVQGDFLQSSGRFRLLYAYVTFNASESLSFRVGQVRGPGLREDSVSSGAQLFPERSVVNSVFRQNDSQGVEATWTSDRFRLTGMVSDGVRSSNTIYSSAGEADVGLVLRAEGRFGDAGWSRFKDFTSFRGSSFGAKLGGAILWESANDTNPVFIGARPDSRMIGTVDLSLEGDGWNAFGAGIWRRQDFPGAPAFDDFGVIAQGGRFVTESTELVLRYDALFPDSDRATPSDDFDTVSGGFNWYISPESHVLKLSGSVHVFLNDQTSLSGLLGASAGQALFVSPDAGQLGFILQMQLVF